VVYHQHLSMLDIAQWRPLHMNHFTALLAALLKTLLPSQPSRSMKALTSPLQPSLLACLAAWDAPRAWACRFTPYLRRGRAGVRVHGRPEAEQGALLPERHGRGGSAAGAAGGPGLARAARAVAAAAAAAAAAPRADGHERVSVGRCGRRAARVRRAAPGSDPCGGEATARVRKRCRVWLRVRAAAAASQRH